MGVPLSSPPRHRDVTHDVYINENAIRVNSSCPAMPKPNQTIWYFEKLKTIVEKYEDEYLRILRKPTANCPRQAAILAMIQANVNNITEILEKCEDVNLLNAGMNAINMELSIMRGLLFTS